MAITSQLEITKKKTKKKNKKKTLKSLFPKETGAVGSGDGALLISVPRSSIHRLRVGQAAAVLAVGVEGFVCTILSFLFYPLL